LTLFITFLTLFLKLLGLQERVPKAFAGNWFQGCRVLFTKEYLNSAVITLKTKSLENQKQLFVINLGYDAGGFKVSGIVVYDAMWFGMKE
jgi:hypothetical protein